MFGWFKIISLVFMLGGVSTIGWIAWSHIQSIKDENRTLVNAVAAQKQSIATLKNSIATQKKAMDFVAGELKRKNAIERQIGENFNLLHGNIRNLESRLNKDGRDIGELALKKPNLIEKTTNRAWANKQRCFELASGSKHTKLELDAVKPSQINSECPGLANPNYIAE